jgi:ectoine hydroxylase-related dioxygenase (phytanoyl-CoA dioxygenase family)
MDATPFIDHGVAIIEDVVPSQHVAHLGDLEEFALCDRPGKRSFAVPEAVAALICAEGALSKLAERLTGQRMRPVRVLYFDKNPNANWAVPWHQDRTIAVARRLDVPGYDTWSIKAGIDHVEPPESILQSMVSLRLHIDECGHDNGPLLALRGSFRLGRVSASEIKRHVTGHETEICCADAGDVVAMRGLTIHASERASRPCHRRVIHVDLSSAELPCGLEWALAQTDAGYAKEVRGGR